MRYVIRYQKAGFGRDVCYIHNVLDYNIRIDNDIMVLSYKRAVRKYIIFGDEVILYFTRYFPKTNLAELSIRESFTHKIKEKMTV